MRHDIRGIKIKKGFGNMFKNSIYPQSAMFSFRNGHQTSVTFHRVPVEDEIRYFVT